METKLLGTRGRRLFGLTNGNGGDRPITGREVIQFLTEASGAEISAKDFRTFRTSAAALAYLTKQNRHESERHRKGAIIEAADHASQILVNTPKRGALQLYPSQRDRRLSRQNRSRHATDGVATRG
jgi:DNA topoisomerase-1